MVNTDLGKYKRDGTRWAPKKRKMGLGVFDEMEVALLGTSIAESRR